MGTGHVDQDEYRGLSHYGVRDWSCGYSKQVRARSAERACVLQAQVNSVSLQLQKSICDGFR
jgi:hypothetical protein